MSIELSVATGHRRDMTEKVLKATLNPNKQQQLDSIGKNNVRNAQSKTVVKHSDKYENRAILGVSVSCLISLDEVMPLKLLF